VVGLKHYGAFVDVGGVDGLVHVSELDWKRVAHPRDVLSAGDEVEVQVKSVDLEQERISLSRKAVLPNPWDLVELDYPIGTLATGTVSNVVDFGVFVALPSGLEGLVHASRMSSLGAAQPGDLVRRGDEVLVRILDVDPGRERIALSMDAVSSEEQAEWMEARAAAEEAEAKGESVSEDTEQQGPLVESDPQADAVSSEEQAEWMEARAAAEAAEAKGEGVSDDAEQQGPLAESDPQADAELTEGEENDVEEG
jgi:ribosomal protein S1